ncbi:MAG TPA: lysoplasmalogenase [Gammaproteobacteria bacterium]|nr:lysoplasmalogenase [Gammaproteobacteria bacterium]
MTTLILLTLAALAALLVAEYVGSRKGVWIAKPAASTGFLAVAVAAGALDSSYGLLVLLGLVLSWWGDVFLIPVERPRIFQAGIASFLLGHAAYVVAFASLGLQPVAAIVTALLMVASVMKILRWLRPHLPPEMRMPVYAYFVVITCMVICAAGAVANAATPMILLGALMFYVSDLAVARDRFVATGFGNRVWGLPLYYGGQLVLASSIAG